MANGNINTQQDPRNILGQLISQNLESLQSEEGEKVLRSFLKKKGEDLLEQPGGQEVLASFVQQKEPNVSQNTQQPQLQQEQQEQQSNQTEGTDKRNIFGELLRRFGRGISQDFRATEADIRRTNLESQRLEQELSGQSGSFEQQKEQRLLGQEERRVREQKLEVIGNRGGRVSESEMRKFNEDLGFDSFSPIIEALGISGNVNKRTGERVFNIPANRDLNEIAKRKTIGNTEMKFFQTQFDAADTMQEVLNNLSGLGIDDPAVLSEIGKAIPANYFSGVGPFSLEARFNSISQFSDPKFNAIKQKLERAFQKFRKVITGAQASDKELRTLRPLIASLTSTPEAFFNIANDLISETNRSVDTRLGLMEDIGRDTKRLRARFESRKLKLGSSVASKGLNNNKIGRFIVEVE